MLDYVIPSFCNIRFSSSLLTVVAWNTATLCSSTLLDPSFFLPSIDWELFCWCISLFVSCFLMLACSYIFVLSGY